MKIIFLGTNGWFETDTGNTLCVLVKSRDYDIVLDAGSGFFRLDRYVDGTRPVYLLLSHFHMDHISGLHGLSKINCSMGLSIIGQTGTRNVIDTIVNRPFTVPVDRLSYKTEVLELPADHGRVPFGLEYLPMTHSDPCLGYRVTVDGKTVAFCTDTGYCENAVNLGRNSDLLITECAFRSGESNHAWPHLNPETAARIALEAGASRLVLTHFDAARYITAGDREKAAISARGVFPGTVHSHDFMEMAI
ncbi:MAG TPA: MBL fold metallo-hydrolase [Spirochaetota bacterium]|nr:MBL fold metallo-hydrolase [Spirochaetota bacterium]HQO40031.1 MBL fold metallo-hydrolase [Spirochaetota bacterium]